MAKRFNKNQEKVIFDAVTCGDVIYRSTNQRYHSYPQQGNWCVPDRTFYTLVARGLFTDTYPAVATAAADDYFAAHLNK